MEFFYDFMRANYFVLTIGTPTSYSPDPNEGPTLLDHIWIYIPGYLQLLTSIAWPNWPLSIYGNNVRENVDGSKVKFKFNVISGCNVNKFENK